MHDNTPPSPTQTPHIYIYTSDVIQYSEVHRHPRHVGVVGDSKVSALVEVATVALAVGELQRVEVTYERGGSIDGEVYVS